ncbi:MAG: rod shape-determining protein MreD [bacterium]|nr:rod shape-determining protein MreD [bacterium]
MKWWVYAVGIIFSIILEITPFVKYLEIRGIKPDLFLIILVFFSLKKGSLKGEIMGFFIGIFEDLVSSGVFGINSFSKTICGFLVGKSKEKILHENFISQIIIMLSISLLNGLLVYLIRCLFTTPSGFIVVPLETCYNTLLSIPIFILFRKL